MLARPWCSVLMSLLHNVQYKLPSIFYKKNLYSESENHSPLTLQTFLGFFDILLLKSAKTNEKYISFIHRGPVGILSHTLIRKKIRENDLTFWKIQLSKLEFNY